MAKSDSCPHCGAEVPENGRFCPECGSEFEVKGGGRARLEYSPPAEVRPGPRSILPWVIGIGIFLFLLCCCICTGFLGIVGGSSEGEDTTPEKKEVSPARQAPVREVYRISASVEDFESEIPILGRLGVDKHDRGDRVDYLWTKVSSMGQSNMVAFYDDGKDGTLDSGLVSVAFPAANLTIRIESMDLLFKVVQVAGGTDVPAGRFADWVNKNLYKNNAARTFGTVKLALSHIKASDGIVLLASLNEKKR